MGFHVEVDFSSFPLFADLDEQCGDEAENGGLVRKEARDASAAFGFLVNAFESLAGPVLS